MTKDASKKQGYTSDSDSVTKNDLRQIRKELKAESEKLKALEVRVGAIEQNLLGN